ncbi:MAG: hypothetical protein RMI34_02290 [Chloroherpetonaceae bacterium]|nr:hypothetical protein [Chloroherpetonaceae bacterium]MCS7212565.1 hypothetical protein [Chloroherpetonaceae bacterium]MDW8018885.1 hypothetical protein [Chloroherpetonaceae bacterium]MDW8466668.1 hypothetical protein [Chloroherpetonaceae bacterium]
MGIWGSDIFDNDAAAAAKAIFEDAIAEGLSVPAATERVLTELGEIAKNEDVLAVIQLALAALQLEHKALDPKLRDEVLHIIRSGKSLGPWADLGETNLAQRKQALSVLGAALSA